MDLSQKLQITERYRVTCVNRPADVSCALPNTMHSQTRDSANAWLFYLPTEGSLDLLTEVLTAAPPEALIWLLYPKARQRGTDLNRDVLRSRLPAFGVYPVRQVAVDEVWTALRVRRLLETSA